MDKYTPADRIRSKIGAYMRLTNTRNPQMAIKMRMCDRTWGTKKLHPEKFTCEELIRLQNIIKTDIFAD